MAEYPLFGVLGGTFDPIHFGHLRPALELLQRLDMARIHFIPNRHPPHRQQPWLDEVRRYALLKSAIRDVPGFVADDRELKREGASYMVDTLSSLREDFPGSRLCLIMGLDAYAGFIRWHRWQDILDLTHLLVMTRPGVCWPAFGEYGSAMDRRVVEDASELRRAPAGRILLQSVTQFDISATYIRQELQAGRSIRFLVPESVRQALEKQI